MLSDDAGRRIIDVQGLRGMIYLGLQMLWESLDHISIKSPGVYLFLPRVQMIYYRIGSDVVGV
jgi:hypothetical protein